MKQQSSEERKKKQATANCSDEPSGAWPLRTKSRGRSQPAHSALYVSPHCATPFHTRRNILEHTAIRRSIFPAIVDHVVALYYVILSTIVISYDSAAHSRVLIQPSPWTLDRVPVIKLCPTSDGLDRLSTIHHTPYSNIFVCVHLISGLIPARGQRRSV